MMLTIEHLSKQCCWAFWESRGFDQAPASGVMKGRSKAFEAISVS